MTYQSSLRHYLFATSLIGLAACSSAPAPAPTVSNPAGGRYSISQDRAPDRQVDIATIVDIIPEPVRRTAAGNCSPYEVLGKTYTVLPTEAGYSEHGIASWYGAKFHGHKTSNGEVFDMFKVSAAHKSLPIPSFLRVTNLDNNRSIVVRVNDRGPFHGDRIIDLSYAAALKLGYAERGTARVQLDAIVVHAETGSAAESMPAAAAVSSKSRSQYLRQYLQVGAFASEATAQQLSSRLREMTGQPVSIDAVRLPDSGVLHRVRIGPLRNAGEIQRLTRQIVAAELGSPFAVSEVGCYW